MRGPREIRRWIDRLRRRYGRKNGVVHVGYFDSPEHERKWAKSFKQRRRNRADANSNPDTQNKGERAA